MNGTKEDIFFCGCSVALKGIIAIAAFVIVAAYLLYGLQYKVGSTNNIGNYRTQA